MNRVAAFSAITYLFLALQLANAESPKADIPVLRSGSKGDHVKLAQALLGIDIDGEFGKATKIAVEEFQRKNSLEVDGVIGGSTWEKLRGSGEFVYIQKTGELKRGEVVWGKGYSGKGKAKNDPESESDKDEGPIPKGKWRIGEPLNSLKTGPFVLPLSPDGHDAKGRTAFQCHGDKNDDPGNASSGCIVLPRHIREHISASGETVLEVKSK